MHFDLNYFINFVAGALMTLGVIEAHKRSLKPPADSVSDFNNPIESFHITVVLGEDPPNTLNLVIVDPNEEEYKKPTKVIVPITSQFRPTANRILSGTETPDDISALKLLVEKHR